MREVAEQNMKEAHAAYEQLTNSVTKATDAWMGAMPSPMAAGFKDMQGCAMRIAKENAESAFTFAGKISKAQNLRDFDASDAVRSRPDEGVHHANAGALQADQGNCPEVRTRLVVPSIRHLILGQQKRSREPTSGGLRGLGRNLEAANMAMSCSENTIISVATQERFPWVVAKRPRAALASGSPPKARAA